MNRKIFVYANIISMLVMGICMTVYMSFYQNLGWYTQLKDHVNLIFILIVPILFICGETLLTLKRSMPIDKVNASLPFIAVCIVVIPAFIDGRIEKTLSGIGALLSMAMLLIMAISFMYNAKKLKIKNGKYKSHDDYKIKK
ncbi:MAG: hypothetical protein N4A40_11885 [Tissierellales bacterium]|nr:hypothetical protein [Tissierellales bacterium]